MNQVVERIVHALDTGDIDEFLGAMSEHIHNDATLGFQEFSKQEVKKLSGQGLPSGLHAACYELWGREVIVVFADTDAGPSLHNIAWPAVVDGEVTYLRGYYFCKELLSEVAQRLVSSNSEAGLRCVQSRFTAVTVLNPDVRRTALWAS